MSGAPQHRSCAAVRVLRDAKWSIGNRSPRNKQSKHRKQIISTYGEATAIALGNFLELFAEVRAPSSDTDHLLVDTNIHPGERQLLRVAYEEQDALIATGDKTALGALLASPSCESVYRAVAGRVVVFETALLGLMGKRGCSSEWRRSAQPTAC